MKHLQPGKSETCSIIARNLWNATGIEVNAGEEYALSAEGEWCDAWIKTTARGYSSAEAPFLSRILLPLFEKLRRRPADKWFVLVGAIGQNEAATFCIGDGLSSWKPGAKGELNCFANDVRIAYGNNHGAVTLVVKRLR